MREPRFHYNSRLFVLPGLRRYSAIVLGRHIFAKGASLPPELMRHEMVHIDQVRRFGVVGFYLRYLVEYFRLFWKLRSHHEAYWNNPYEVEAREAEGNFSR